VLCSVTRLVIIKVNIDGFQLYRPLFDLPGPCAQLRPAIAALIFACAGTVEPDISEICGDIEGRVIARKLIDAEGCVVALQQAIDFRSHPAQFAKFKGVTMAAGQNLQQSLQPFKIQFPLWRKLKENRSQLFAQVLSAGKNVIESVFRIFEFLVMRDESAGFYSKHKIFRRGGEPRLKSFNRRQPIKAVVQFQRIKMTDIIVEHLRCGRLWRVERSYPVLVVIAGGANANVAAHVVSAMKLRAGTLSRAISIQLTAFSQSNIAADFR